MRPARIAIYVVIALVVAVLAYHVLVKEPHPAWPINLVHLLARH